MKFSRSYHSVLRRASRLASCEGVDCIYSRHVFWALIGEAPRIFNRLLGRKSLIMHDQLRLQADGEKPEVRMPISSEVWRILCLDGGVLGEVMESVGGDVVNAAHVAAAMIMGGGLMAEVLGINGINLEKERDAILDKVRQVNSVRRRGASKDAMRKVSAIRAALFKVVVGQTRAIDEACDVLFRAWQNPPAKFGTPPSIFISGECGSDIEFASALADEICRAQGISAKPLTLNGALFASDKDAPDLSGMDKNWKNPQNSKFKPVDAEPRLPIVVTNAEQLHNRCLPLFLEAAHGLLRDQYDGKDIDFSQSVFIFTSSAGSIALQDCADEFSKNVVSRERLGERLCSHIPDYSQSATIRTLIENCTVSIAMKPLNPTDLREIARRKICDEITGLKSFYRKIEADEDALATVVVESLSSLDKRAIPSVVASITEPLRKNCYTVNAAARCRKLKISVSESIAFDAEKVLGQLSERKHLDFSVRHDRDVKKSQEAITVVLSGYVCLPAIHEGMIIIDVPSDYDTFDNLVGIEKPRACIENWRRFINGEIDIRPDGLLLVGPPGFGKTSFGRAMARELGIPYCVISSRELASPDAIADVMSTIRKYSRSGLIVAMDEIDSFCSNRADKHEAYVERLNLILSGMDGFSRNSSAKTLWVGMSNRPEALDPAVTRSGRLGTTVYFCPLAIEERLRLIKMAAKEYGLDVPQRLYDFASKISEGMSPADIKATVREVALSREPILDERSFLKARAVVSDGMVTQPTEITEEEKIVTAYHEASHCLVAETLGRSYAAVSIESSGRSLGYFEPMGSGLDSSTGEGILDSIAILLAGRAGNELTSGQPTDGATSDIAKASAMAIHYIQAGFSEEWGLGVPEEIEWRDAAPIVKPLLKKQYSVAKEILSKERPWLERLKTELLEKKILFQDEVRALRESVKSERSR